MHRIFADCGVFRKPYPVKNHPILLAFLPLVLLSPKEEIVSDRARVLYTSLNLEKQRLSAKAFDMAWKAYEQLLHSDRLANPGYLAICDMSQSSKQKRFYLIDIENSRLLVNTYVAHGRNSGAEFASRFSNKPNSLQTSLGIFITGSTYHGEHGLSLTLHGMQPGLNDRAAARRIVIHGADYASPAFIRKLGYLGRSYGCPSLPKNESAEIIRRIRNGSLVFIYHPSIPEKTIKAFND